MSRKRTKEQAEWVFGMKMEPCPKCGCYDMHPQTPIILDKELDAETPRGLIKQAIGAWVDAHKDNGPTLDGRFFLMCFGCGHKGPSVDISGRSVEDVGRDAKTYREVKRLWNEQPKELGTKGGER